MLSVAGAAKEPGGRGGAARHCLCAWLLSPQVWPFPGHHQSRRTAAPLSEVTLRTLPSFLLPCLLCFLSACCTDVADQQWCQSARQAALLLVLELHRLLAAYSLTNFPHPCSDQYDKEKEATFQQIVDSFRVL